MISIQNDSNHREKEQETPHVSALAGLVELAAVIETDEEAKQLIETLSIIMPSEVRSRTFQRIQHPQK